MKIPSFPKKPFGFVLFVSGVALILLGHMSVAQYTQAHVDNYLAPAGRFFPGDSSFSFAILGDSAMRNRPLNAVLQDIIGKEHAFALNVGDQARRPNSSHFEWMLQEIRDEIGDFSYFAVPGNHDIAGREDGRRLRYYKRAFGQPYYWFSHGETLFVGLDSSTKGLGAEQLVWLESTLSRLRGDFKSCLIFMHVPPTDPRPNSDYCMKRDIESFRDIVKTNNITAIFAGHIHQFLQGEFGGASLYITPPSGQVMRGKTREFGYLSVTMGADGAVSVNHVPVTADRGMEYMEYYFSTEVQRYPTVELGLLLILLGFGLQGEYVSWKKARKAGGWVGQTFRNWAYPMFFGNNARAASRRNH